MRTFSIFIKSFVCAVLCLAAAGFSSAQSDRGTIAGTILDTSGGVIVGATVSATGVTTGTVYKTTSTSTGAYRLGDLQVGAYDITVSAPGFKTSENKGFVVQINTTSALDITLQPGDIKETLTVIADAPTLQTQTSDIGTVVGNRQIIELPLALGGQGDLRAPEAFVFLTPGTVGPGSSDSNNGIFQAKLAGGQNFGNEIILDGASTSRADSGSSFDQTAPSVEAIDEFKITTSTVPAEFGRTSGGVESFTTKSGTNSFHGSAYDLFHNDALFANSWFNNLNGSPRDTDRKNDYGGTFGGPVWIPKLYNGRDKTFFFFSWEQFRQQLSGTSNNTLPIDAYRSGDFSSLLGAPLKDGSNNTVINPCDGTPVLAGQIFDPLTTQTIGSQQCRTAFANNTIPADRISAVAKNLLAIVPHAQINQTHDNFLFSSSNPRLTTAMTFRIDHTLNQNSKIFFSYSSRDNAVRNGTPNLPDPIANGAQFQDFFTHYVRAGWDYTFNSSLVNHINVGLNRVNSNDRSGAVGSTDWDASLGLQGASGPTFPQFGFGGNLGLTSFGQANAADDVINALVVADSVSWVRGRHSLRFGVDWRASQFSVIDRSHQSPGLNFGPDQTAFVPAEGDITGNEFASFLLGDVASGGLAVRSSQPRFVSNYYAFYVQDDFKVSKTLVLNLGLRYDIDTPRHDSHGNTSIFDPTATNPGATGVLGALRFAGNGNGRDGSNGQWADTYYKDFAPRIGFAWAPTMFRNRSVLRGGYGLYYAPLTYADFGQSLTDGFTASPSFNSNDSYTAALHLDTGIPAFPPPPNLDPAQENGGSGGGFGGISYVAPGYGRPGMVQNWSLELEHQFTQDLILSVGYVGTRATHLRSSLAEINNLNPQFFAFGNKLSSAINSPDATLLGVTAPFPEFTTLYGPGTISQALRPIPQYGSIDTDCCLENLGQSSYNALLTKVERRFRNGLNLLASYTYSRTITDADSALPAFASFSGGGSVQNSYNLKGEKSVSYQDIPHIFVISYIYELPVGKGRKFLNKGGTTDKVIGGWQIGGVQRYQSGQPLTFGCATGVPSFDGCIRYSRVPGQPLVTGNGIKDVKAMQSGGIGCIPDSANPGFFINDPSNSGNAFFNCKAFFDPNFTVSSTPGTPYSFGDMPRTTSEIRSQGYVNEDFSILKRTRLFESSSLVFKAEMLNAFNRHVFGRPDTGPRDGTFGAVFGTVDGPRQVQFTLRLDF